ncbi:NUDIX hydrolase [Alkaliphilus serpentinus]|uniref:NUDIX hydrolase n=1 Tax=Alkaliphilus serpentinus TaxID=1482731 RepID=A0A833HMD8_9FIRM|nr:NUDIX hydrolase [Alkaliphilus serpentinus]KAB3527376.1 NUDIX hydrolase [Alkaliphilus serpentinus]
MTREEKTMKSEKIYEGKVINLRVDTVELPDRKYSKREIVEHSGAVGILAITNDDKLIFVKQFRKTIEDELLEIPAGRIETDEIPDTTAARELEEETGFKSNKLKKLTAVLSSPGFSNEVIHIYLAEDLQEGTAQPDEDEYIEVIYLTLEEALDKILKGEIRDSKTTLAVLFYKALVLG